MNWENAREFDRELGIDTSLTDTDWSQRRMHPCQPTPLAALRAASQRLCPEDCVVDYGCGAGRAVFALAHGAGCRVVGVELDARRYALAEENLRRCARRAPGTAAHIRLINGPAQAYEPGGEVTTAYFFNPFPAAVLRGVLRRLDGMNVRLMLYYPDDDWVRLLEDEGWRLAESVDLRSELGRDSRERLDIFIRSEI